jgi:hypothetical protein
MIERTAFAETLPVAGPPAPGKSHFWQQAAFSFGDVLDMINPLQHIPVVNTIYRAITGDEIGHAPRLVGGALFGGPIGLVAGIFSVASKASTGKDPGEHALALLDLGPAEAAPDAPVLAAAPAPAVGSVEILLDDEAAMPGLAERRELASLAAPAALPAVEPDHPPMPLAAPVGAGPARTLPVPLQPTAALPRPHAAPGGPPDRLDLSRQMMDALDKYAQLKAERGGRVDLAQ